MIYFVSHFEGIPGRNLVSLSKQLTPCILWNIENISKYQGAQYLLIGNDASRSAFKNIDDAFFVNRDTIDVDIKKQLSSLYNAYISTQDLAMPNYGLDFEFKCFERFFLLKTVPNLRDTDLVIHLDCDIILSDAAISKIMELYENLLKTSEAKPVVYAVNNYSSYLAAFTPLALSAFCDFILNDYLNKYFSFTYRICDMGAFDAAIKQNAIFFEKIFPELNSDSLSADLLSFQPLSALLAKGDSDDKPDYDKWWKMSDVTDEEIIAICSSPNFFKITDDQQILRNNNNAFFVHFHGATKRFIAPLLTP